MTDIIQAWFPYYRNSRETERRQGDWRVIFF